MSKLVELYIEANKIRYGRYQTEEEFMHDMNNKEYVDPYGINSGTVRFFMTIGSGENRELIQEEHSFRDLKDIYFMFKKEQ